MRDARFQRPEQDTETVVTLAMKATIVEPRRAIANHEACLQGEHRGRQPSFPYRAAATKSVRAGLHRIPQASTPISPKASAEVLSDNTTALIQARW